MYFFSLPQNQSLYVDLPIQYIWMGKGLDFVIQHMG